MRIETTPTYKRFFFGPHYFTWIFERLDSEQAFCKIIELAPLMSYKHIKECRDYLVQLGKDKAIDEINEELGIINKEIGIK